MRIAIMDFQPKEISKADAEMVSELIRNEMANSGSFIIIERVQMGNILKEQGLQQSGCTDISCAVELGKILSANKMLIGTVMNMQGKKIITGRIVDVQSGAVDFSEKGVADSQKEIYTAVIAFTRDLTARIGSGDTNTVKVEKKKKQDETPAELKSSNPYTFPAFGFTGFSLLSFGGGYYYNMKVAAVNSDYSKTSALYKTSTNSAQATALGDKMDAQKKDSDKFSLYRNISYGIGAASLLTSGYFFYRYFAYAPAAGASLEYKKNEIIPLIFSGYSMPGQRNSDRNFFGCGMLMRF